MKIIENILAVIGLLFLIGGCVFGVLSLQKKPEPVRFEPRMVMPMQYDATVCQRGAGEKVEVQGVHEKGKRMRHAMELFEPAFDEAAEAHAETMRHRELDICEALDECKAKGVSTEALKVLAFESGARWTPKEA